MDGFYRFFLILLFAACCGSPFVHATVLRLENCELSLHPAAAKKIARTLNQGYALRIHGGEPLPAEIFQEVETLVSPKPRAVIELKYIDGEWQVSSGAWHWIRSEVNIQLIEFLERTRVEIDQVVDTLASLTPGVDLQGVHRIRIVRGKAHENPPHLDRSIYSIYRHLWGDFSAELIESHQFEFDLHPAEIRRRYSDLRGTPVEMGETLVSLGTQAKPYVSTPKASPHRSPIIPGEAAQAIRVYWLTHTYKTPTR